MPNMKTTQYIQKHILKYSIITVNVSMVFVMDSSRFYIYL